MAEEEVDWEVDDLDWRGEENSKNAGDTDDADDVLSLDGGEAAIDEDAPNPRSSPRRSSTGANPHTNDGTLPTGPSASRIPPTGPRKSASHPPSGPKGSSSVAAALTGSRSVDTNRSTASPAADESKGKSSLGESVTVDNQTSTSSTAKSDSNGTASAGNSDRQKSPGNEPALPPGWQAIMSKSHQRPFYYHKESNTTVWDRPTAPAETETETKEELPKSPPLQSAESKTSKSVTEGTAREEQEVKVTPKVVETKKPPTGPAASSVQADPIASAYARRKAPVPPLGPAKRDSEADYMRSRDRDVRQTDLDRDKRRQRDFSPQRPEGQDARDVKRFRANDGRATTDDYRQRSPPRGPRQEDRRPGIPPRQDSAPRASAYDDRSRDFDRPRYAPNEFRPSGRSPPRAPTASASRGSDTGPARWGQRAAPSNVPSSATEPSSSRPNGRDSTPSRPAPTVTSDSAEAARARLREEARKAQEKLKFLQDEEERLDREEAESKRRAEEDRKRKEEDAKRRADDRRREDDRREDERRRGDDRRNMYPSRPSRRDDGPYPVNDRPPQSATFSPAGYEGYKPSVGGPPDVRGPKMSERSYRPPSSPERYPLSRDDDRSYRPAVPGIANPRPLSARIDGSRYRDERDFDRDRERYRRPISPPPRLPEPPLSARLGRRSPPPSAVPMSSRLGPRIASPPPPRRNGESYHPDDHRGGPPPRSLATRMGLSTGGRGSELSAEPMSARAQDGQRDRRTPPPPLRRERDDRALPSRPLAERMSVDTDRRVGGGGDRWENRDRDRRW